MTFLWPPAQIVTHKCIKVQERTQWKNLRSWRSLNMHAPCDVPTQFCIRRTISLLFFSPSSLFCTSLLFEYHYTLVFWGFFSSPFLFKLRWQIPAQDALWTALFASLFEPREAICSDLMMKRTQHVFARWTKSVATNRIPMLTSHKWWMAAFSPKPVWLQTSAGLKKKYSCTWNVRGIISG